MDQPLRGKLEDVSLYDVSGTVNQLAKGTLVFHANDNAAYRMVNQLLAKGVKVSRALEGASGQGESVSSGDFLVDAAAMTTLKDAATRNGIGI